MKSYLARREGGLNMHCRLKTANACMAQSRKPKNNIKYKYIK